MTRKSSIPTSSPPIARTDTVAEAASEAAITARWRATLDRLKAMPAAERRASIDIEQASLVSGIMMSGEPSYPIAPISAASEPILRVIDGYREYCRESVGQKAASDNCTISNSTDDKTLEDLSVFEVSGTIKWFDASKGYGFIVPDSGLPDILLHVTCLRAGGYQTAYEGARIHFLALARPRGIQAFRILGMDDSTAIDPSQLPQRTHVVVTPESGWERATVIWFNRVRGFGFLSRVDDDLQIFVHMETMRRFGFTELRPGQEIDLRWGFGPKGRMAAELRAPDRAKQSDK